MAWLQGWPFNGRVTLLAGPTILHIINTLAYLAESTQSMPLLFLASGQVVNVFLIKTFAKFYLAGSVRVTWAPFPWATFLHINWALENNFRDFQENTVCETYQWSNRELQCRTRQNIMRWTYEPVLVPFFAISLFLQSQPLLDWIGHPRFLTKVYSTVRIKLKSVYEG